MTTNLLHGNATDARSPDGSGVLAIGEVDASVFGCPRCSRPLADGTSKCPGCGVRLVFGVIAKRAAGLLATGVAFGIMATAVATAAVVTVTDRPATPATVVTPSVAPVATQRPAVPSAPAQVAGNPPAAISALSGTAVVNGRITVDAETLEVTLARPSATSIQIARAMRSLAADAALGSDLASRLSQWPDAAPVMADLDLFYRAMADTARSALRVSFTDTAAYRAAGDDMLRVLTMLGEVDRKSRVLAGTVGLELPPVVIAGPPADSAS